jgi:hypothetical protein
MHLCNTSLLIWVYIVPEGCNRQILITVEGLLNVPFMTLFVRMVISAHYIKFVYGNNCCQLISWFLISAVSG